MDLPFKMDLGYRNYRRVMDITLPLFTGGVLLVGGALLSSDFRVRAFSVFRPGYGSIAIAVFACLTVGYLFVGATNLLAYSFLLTLNRVTKNGLVRRLTQNPPWLSSDWQKFAKEMVKHISGQDINLETNEERRRWYLVLKQYFDLPDDYTREGFYAYMFLHAVGWAGIVVMALSNQIIWFMLIFCAVCVIFGFQGIYYMLICNGSFGIDNQWVALMAQILHELRDGQNKGVFETDVSQKRSTPSRALNTSTEEKSVIEIPTKSVTPSASTR